MKSIVLILSPIIGLLLVINFPISFCSQSQSQSQNGSDAPPVMPVHPPPPVCTGFPGSLEWNQCWDNFRQNMQNFASQMQHYQSQLNNMTYNQTNDGATSSVYMNGYSIRGQGLNVNSNSANGRFNIEVFIGKPENISVNTTTDHQIKWDLAYPRNVTKWLIFRAPQTVNMSSISHVIRDEKIVIFGPTDDNGSSSSSSFSSNTGFGGVFN